jgi:hypothetical protein
MEWALCDPMEFVRATSIRTRALDATPEYVKPLGVAAVDEEAERLEMRKRGIKCTNFKTVGASMQAIQSGEHYSLESDEINLVRESILSMPHGGMWNELRFKSFYRKTKNTYHLVVESSSPGAQYCLIKHGEHQNNICFQITRCKIYQKCFSNNPECQNESYSINTDTVIADLLFENIPSRTMTEMALRNANRYAADDDEEFTSPSSSTLEDTPIVQQKPSPPKKPVLLTHAARSILEFVHISLVSIDARNANRSAIVNHARKRHRGSINNDTTTFCMTTTDMKKTFRTAGGLQFGKSSFF